MSQSNLNSINFENCLEILCQSLIKNRKFINDNHIKNKPCFKGFTGHHIGAFKRTYPTIIPLINSSFSDNASFEIDSKNVSQVLFSLFVKTLPKNYGKYSYIMLCDLVNFNPSISECGNFDEEDLNVLLNLKLKAESEFNYDVDDPFVIKDTQQSNDQTSSSTIAQNKENNFSFSEDSVSIFKSFLKEQIDELRLDFENKVNRIKQEINGSVGTEMYLTSERLDIFSKKIKHLFNKKLRYENDLKILKLHRELNTVPEQLNFNKFPEPFLKHNDRFIQKYNTLISKFQNEIISTISEELEEELKILNKDLSFYKRNLNGFVDNINEFVENIHKKEEDNLKTQFIDSDNKARRVILKPFVVSSKNSKEQPYLNTPKRESVDKRKENLHKSASNHNLNRSFDQNRSNNNDIREKSYSKNNSKNKRFFNFNQSSNSNRSSSKNRNDNLNLNRNFNDKGNGFLNGYGNAHPRNRSNSTQRNRQDTSQFNNNNYKRNGVNNQNSQRSFNKSVNFQQDSILKKKF